MARSRAARWAVAGLGAVAAHQVLGALAAGSRSERGPFGSGNALGSRSGRGPFGSGNALGSLARAGGFGSPGLARQNFRGERVSLDGGPALAVGATLAAVAGADNARVAAAAALAGLGSGLVGRYDDVVGARPEQRAAKGFRGHLAALFGGRVTSGMVKVAGVGAAGLAAASVLTGSRRTGSRRTGSRSSAGRAADTLLAAGVIAGTANLVNLLDLRPGRALKAGILLSAPLAATGGSGGGVASGVAGACTGLLPADLSERAMLGDAGANALGALVGTALVARTGRLGQAALLAGIVGLTGASERISFTSVIGRTPVLRELDALGRRAG